MNRNTKMLITVMTMAFLSSTHTFAAEKKSHKKSEKKATTPAETPIKVDGSSPTDDVVTSSSTHIDFSETSIDGKMKAPDGFFLQGHNGNSLSQMVKLRSNFHSELRNSSSDVKSHVR